MISINALPYRLLHATMPLVFIIVCAVVPGRVASDPLDQGHLMTDHSFGQLRPGTLAASSPNTGWEVQRVGREIISDLLRVECVRDRKAARTGQQCVALSLPGATIGFEYVTIGQRIPVLSDRVYSVSVRVRWPDGPDRAPQWAGRTSGHRSAIVSFWSRLGNSTGSFAGRDVWLFDRQWHRLSYQFCTPDAADRALVYVSLLPNQRPVPTKVIVDDFTVASLPMPEPRGHVREVVTRDASLSSQAGPTLRPP